MKLALVTISLTAKYLLVSDAGAGPVLFGLCVCAVKYLVSTPSIKT